MVRRRVQRNGDGLGRETGRTVRVLVSRTCEWCGREMAYAGRGRPPRYCSQAHRQRAYELRTALARRDADRAAGRARGAEEPVREVVRETVVRTVTRTVRGPVVEVPVEVERPVVPTRAHEVQAVLEDTADAVMAGRIPHWDHRRLWQGVARLMAALDATHPGGVDTLARRR